MNDSLRVLGPGHPDTLATRSYLANWQGEAGDPPALPPPSSSSWMIASGYWAPDTPIPCAPAHNSPAGEARRETRTGL